jgi:hypothetical protein
VARRARARASAAGKAEKNRLEAGAKRMNQPVVLIQSINEPIER